MFDDKEYKKAHEYFINYRSQYIVHSNNDFERGTCGVILSDRNPSKATLIGLAFGSIKLQYPRDLEYQLNWLKRLIFKCQNFIGNELQFLQEKICNNPELVLTAPDLAKVKKMRSNKK